MNLEELENEIQDLRADYKEKFSKARGIMEKIRSENRSVSEEEKAEFETLTNECDSLMVDIESRQKLVDLEKRGLEPSKPGEPNKELTKKLESPAGGFRCFGEMLQAVATSEITRSIDSRLRWVSDRETREGETGETRAPSGQNVSVGSDGGFLVQPQYMEPLLDLAFETGQVASRCNQIPVSSRRLIWNAIQNTSRATGSRYGGVQVYFEGEAESPTAKKVEFKDFEINLRKIVGLAYATEEAMEDAMGLGSYIQDAYANEFGFVIDDKLINGSGGKSFLGILNQKALVTVAKETGQTADTIVKENIDKIWNAQWAGGRQNSTWFINQECEPQLDALAMPVGTGGAPVYLPAGGLSATPFSTLKGRPVVPIEQCAALGDKGDIILANMKQYILARRGGLNAQTSIHVKFVEGETAFRFVVYVGGGTPWVSALTPYKGTGTYSPFVTLAARS